MNRRLETRFIRRRSHRIKRPGQVEWILGSLQAIESRLYSIAARDLVLTDAACALVSDAHSLVHGLRVQLHDEAEECVDTALVTDERR